MSAAALARDPGAVSGERACATAGGGLPPSAQAFVSLILPAPPSANALFQNKPGKGRARTKLYDDWLGHAGWRLREQRPASLLGPVLVIVGIERTSRQADIDNRIKATLDLLVSHKVMQDDKFVAGLAIAWNPAKNGLMRLLIMPAANATVHFQLAPNGAEGGWYLQAPSEEEGMADGH